MGIFFLSLFCLTHKHRAFFILRSLCAPFGCSGMTINTTMLFLFHCCSLSCEYFLQASHLKLGNSCWCYGLFGMCHCFHFNARIWGFHADFGLTVHNFCSSISVWIRSMWFWILDIDLKLHILNYYCIYFFFIFFFLQSPVSRKWTRSGMMTMNFMLQFKITKQHWSNRREMKAIRWFSAFKHFLHTKLIHTGRTQDSNTKSSIRRQQIIFNKYNIKEILQTILREFTFNSLRPSQLIAFQNVRQEWMERTVH